MIDILFMVPYAEIRKVVEEVFAERRDDEPLVPHICTSCTLGPDEDPLRFDAVISRGFSAGDFRGADLPHVEMRVTGYDIINAIRECVRRYGSRRVAVIGTAGMIDGAEGLDGALGDVRVAAHILEDREAIAGAVARAAAGGADAMIGGLSVYEHCRSRNIDSMMILSGRESVRHAVDEAVGLVKIRREEEGKRQRLRAIMDYSFGGIVSFGVDGGVETMNKYAASFFNLPEPAGARIDQLMPGLDYARVVRGGEAFADVLTLHKPSRVVAVNCAAIGSADTALGAVLTFQDVTEIQELEGAIRQKIHRSGFAAKYRFADICHCGERMRETIDVAGRYAAVDSNVLLFGETGTGKELLAQSIHNASRRRNRPFVAINCAALPEHLLESELFGYSDGAFTGAVRGGKAGLFELAHGGTIFLDEIGDIPLGLQPRLLRVIQEREIMRLGGDRITPVDVRVVSATNRNLKLAAGEGAFRRDLLHRLDTLVLAIPPLRMRREDIIPLAERFIAEDRKALGLESLRLAPGAEEVLLAYSWPGNVRELRNFCERLCVIVQGGAVDAEAAGRVLDQYRDWDGDGRRENAKGDVAQAERSRILDVLREANFSRSVAAKRLGMDKSTLWRKMRKHQLL